MAALQCEWYVTAVMWYHGVTDEQHYATEKNNTIVCYKSSIFWII